MSRPTSKVAIPGAMIDRLREGPYSLTHKAALGSLGAHPLREATRRELHRDYKLWLETWVVPELERLLTPREREHRQGKVQP